MLEQILDGQKAAPLLGPPLAHREHPGEPPVAGAIRGVDDDLRGVLFLGKDDAGADRQADAALLRGHVGPNDAREGVAICDGGEAVAQRGGGMDELFRVAGSAQEAEVRRDPELGIGGRGHLGPDRGVRARLSRVLDDLG